MNNNAYLRVKGNDMNLDFRSQAVFRNYIESEKNKLQLLTGNQKYVTPVRLQAYERVILLLERITIESLALRIQKPNMKSIQLQILMLGTVRKEFNHNLSQQLYISTSAWLAVKNAKEQIVRAINLTGTKMNPKLNASDFSKALMQTYSEFESRPVETAIGIVKKEAERYFGM